MDHRYWLGLAVLLCGIAAAPAPISAQDVWPSKPIRIIVNFGPGGSADNTIRPMVDGLTKLLGQQVVIENRGGASGALGLEALSKSAPDGYTFGLTPSLSLVILPHLRKTPYDPLNDFTPVVMATTGTLLLSVHPSIPANTAQEFGDYVKKNPGKVSWGTAGVGSFGHLLCEAFKLQLGADILHVPYRGGGESLQDFLAGVHQVHADPNTLPHVAAGKAKLLAVSDLQRHPHFPNVPLMKEIWPELDFVVWFAMLGPPGLSPEIAKKMSEAVNKIAAEPAVKEQLLKTALAPAGGGPAELAAATKADNARFGALIRKLDIKAE